MGPIPPAVLPLLVLLALVLSTVVSIVVNGDIASHYCDVDAVAGRGACAGFAAFVAWHTALVALNLALILAMFVVRLPAWTVVAPLATFIAAELAIIGAWTAVFFMDISTYTRSVTFFGERSGLRINLILLLGVLGLQSLAWTDRSRGLARLRSIAARSIGPLRPSATRIALVLAVAAAAFFAYSINQDLPAFLCDPNDFTDRGAYPDLAGGADWHAGFVALGPLAVAACFVFRVPALVVALAVGMGPVSTAMVIGTWGSAFLIDASGNAATVSAYARIDGVLINAAVLFGQLALAWTVCAGDRGRA